MTDYTPGNEPNETGEPVTPAESFDDFALRRMLDANEDSWLSGSRMRATIQRLMSERDGYRYNPIEADDFRLVPIWERACEIACNANHCSEFDDMMVELGTGFTRTKTYSVDVEVTLTRIVSVTVTCSYGDDPMSEVDTDLVEEYMEFGTEPRISDWTCISSEEIDD
jgi:hypothetical protein